MKLRTGTKKTKDQECFVRNDRKYIAMYIVFSPFNLMF